jgi:hypothetical protein
MSRHAVSIATGLTLLAAAAGCYVHPVRLDNVEYARFDDTRPREIRAEECGALFFLVPFRLNSQLIRLQRTLAAHAPDSVLTDVRVEQSWIWLGLGDLMCTKVSATAYPKLP